MNEVRRQIIALGGGGFSMEPHNPLLDRYIFAQCGKPNPKVCFVGTASGDSQVYVDRFYANMKKHACRPSHLSLFRGHTAEIETFILEQDILYVGGGNTRNLLTLWRDWGVDRAIRRAYENGVVLAGVSAGSICWFEQGVTDSVPGTLSSLNALGWLKGSNCPHYDGEAERRPSFHRLLKSGAIAPGLATEDGVAAHFVNEALHRIVSSHPERRAYSVRLENGEARETVHVPQYLGGEVRLIRQAALADAEAIHEAHMRSIREVCAKDYSEREIQGWGNREFNPAKWEFSIRQDHVWVLEEKGRIEGYAHLRISGAEAKAFGLYLTSRGVGQGLGQALLELMIQSAKDARVEMVSLDATITAHEFYRKAGFTDAGPEITHEIGGVAVRCYPMKMKVKT